MTITFLGGIGVFLLGMVMLTEGLKGVAGDALRRVLSRSVATPISGVWWGAAFTTLVQSSTATTFATIGFVSAGLLAFTPAVGVIMGANLGTTSTAWIVSQLGFKISLGTISPPLVLVGVVLRLLFAGRLAHVGTALAGFALLFMGIDLLQTGMSVLSDRMSPGDLPGGTTGVTWTARLILVGFGFMMTVVMFSSSASMTTTLAAVATGAIGLEQAAALIVGQNIGTTPKAVAASMGANTAAKRTAFAHVLFNLLTGIVALAILPWLLQACEWTASKIGIADAPTTLAIFHTAFNVLGVALLLPVIRPFARLIEWILPERDKGPRALRYLSPSAADVGPVALEAARRAMMAVLIDTASVMRALLPTTPDTHAGSRHNPAHTAHPPGLRPGVSPTSPHAVRTLTDATTAVGKILGFIARIGRQTQSPAELLRQQDIVHAADHVDRFVDALRSPPAPISVLATDSVLSEAADLIRRTVNTIPPPPDSSKVQTDAGDTPDAESIRSMVSTSMAVSAELAEFRKAARLDAISQTASGAIEPQAAMARIDTLLWLDSIAYHLWRALHHLQHNDGQSHIDPSPIMPEIAGTPPHSDNGRNGEHLQQETAAAVQSDAR